MLKQLRRIAFPEAVQTSGPVVKASLIGHVSTYNDLIDLANRRAHEIVESAKAAADQLKAEIRDQIASELHQNLNQIKLLTRQKEQTLIQQASSICLQVCSVIIEDFIAETPDQQKIHRLATALLHRAVNTRNLALFVHPSQVELVNNVIGNSLAEQFNVKTWSVEPDEDMPPHNIQIRSHQGAEIQVSLSNLVSLYHQEIKRLAPTFIQNNEQAEATNESLD